MNWRHLRLTVLKDGLEILRDRRTLFVNLVLPVLLYPVLTVVTLQVLQITAPSGADLPGVVLVDVPPAVAEHLPLLDPRPEEPGRPSRLATDQPTATADRPTHTDAPPVPDASARPLSPDEAAPPRPDWSTPPASDQASPPAAAAGQPTAASTATSDRLRRITTDQAGGLIELARALRPQLMDPDEPTEHSASDDPSAAEEQLLASMRQADAAALLLGGETEPSGQHRLLVLVDNAHRDALSVLPALQDGLERAQQAMLEERLAQAALPPDFIRPLDWQQEGLAPRSEATRTRLAGLVPLILLLMAVSGAFYPALDLIAWGFERGTLETLLSWPGDRQAIFTGKLLVVMAAALVTVLLNLASLGLTAGIIGSQLPAAQNPFGDGISIGLTNLLVGLLLLIPLTLTLATTALALAGVATSFKEAQNYLSPFMLLVMTPGMFCLLPQVRPNFLLDLVPVLGPLLVLKASLQADAIPWGHVLLAGAASTLLCAVVVQWSVRLLGSEGFLYPNLLRRGWGRFARHLAPAPAPGGMEVLLLWAAVVGCFLVTSALFAQAHPVLRVAGPLTVGVLLPTLLHSWLGRYDPRAVLRLQPVSLRTWTLLPAICVLAGCCALAVGVLQLPVVPQVDNEQAQEQLTAIVETLRAIGGVPLLLVCLALVPGVCEEALFRGPILVGLRRSLGRSSAVVLSSFLFAAMHMSPARFFPQFTLGLLLALLTLRSRSVIPAICLHAAFNGSIILLEDIGGAPTPGAPTPMPDDPLQAMAQDLGEHIPLLSGIGPKGLLGLAALVAALAGAGCIAAIRQTQPHHRCLAPGEDPAIPGDSPS